MIRLEIERIGLSDKAYNCLKKAGVDNIKEMALIDLSILSNCGEKTLNEITNKIDELIEEGYYDKEFTQNYIYTKRQKDNFIDSLELSFRAKKILKRLNIGNIEDLLLLTKEELMKVKNAGKNSVDEITNYISNNINTFNITSKLVIEKICFPISKINCVCGETSIEKYKMSNELKKILEINNIYNIYDLITLGFKIIDLSNNVRNEYSAMYNYFYDIVYKNTHFNISTQLRNIYINIPFKIENFFEKGESINIGMFVDTITSNFIKFEYREQINIKLFLYWLNKFGNIDLKEYLIESLMLREKELEIMSKRTYMTLGEIGNELNITRERVRQIEANAIKKINDKYIQFPFKLLSAKDIYYTNECSDEELLLLFLDQTYDKNYINTADNGNNVYFSSELVTKIKKLLDDKKEDIEYNGYLRFDDYKDEKLLKLSVDYLNLKQYNNHIFYNITKSKQVKYATRYLNKAINISNKEDRTSIINTVKYLYETELEDTRGLESLITRDNIRIDSGTYSANDTIIPLDEETLNKIVSFVREKEIINTKDLFIPFGDILKLHKIDNSVILYRHLKSVLNGKLFFNGISEVISSKEELGSWSDIIIKEIKETGKPVNKLYIQVKYSISDGVYTNIVINIDDIIQWSSKELYLKSLFKISEDTLTKLKKVITQKQILSFDEIKLEMLKLDSKILESNNIKSEANLSCFLQNILSEEYIIDKKTKTVKIKTNKVRTIEKEFSTIEELTL